MTLIRTIPSAFILLALAVSPAAARHHRASADQDAPFVTARPQVPQPHQSAADAYNNQIVENGMTRDELDRKSNGY